MEDEILYIENSQQQVVTLFLYLSWLWQYSGSCKIHAFSLCQRFLTKWSVVPGKLMLRVNSVDHFIQENPTLEVRRAVPLRFFSKQSRWWYFLGCEERLGLFCKSTLPWGMEVDTHRTLPVIEQ